MIEKQLGLTDGLSFFKGYGDSTLLMWNQFQEVLNEVPDDEAVIDSANATFSGFNSWLTNELRH